MSCERPCGYRQIFEDAIGDLGTLVERDHAEAVADEEAAMHGWGHRGYVEQERGRKSDIERLQRILDTDSMLCGEGVCGLALQATADRVGEVSLDIKLQQERL